MNRPAPTITMTSENTPSRSCDGAEFGVIRSRRWPATELRSNTSRSDAEVPRGLGGTRSSFLIMSRDLLRLA